MAFESQQALGGPFPIVATPQPFSSNTLPLGTLAYWQTGIFGTPLGLLLALTMTPQFLKVLQTSNGLRKVS
jgi:hypothetical protein